MFKLALLNCVRALGGFTLARDVETVFDTENFTEKQFLLDLKSRGGDVPPAMNWWVSPGVLRPNKLTHM